MSILTLLCFCVYWHVTITLDYAMLPGTAGPVPATVLTVRIYLVMLFGALFWCGLILLAPILTRSGWSGTAVFLYDLFHRICHQLDGRTLHIAGEPLAVCTRCTAVYFSFLTATALYPIVRRLHATATPATRWLAVAVAPMVLDVLLNVTGLHKAGTETRLITGAIAGGILPFFIIPVLTGAVHELAGHRLRTTIPSTSRGLSDA
jgi:uncharacterized membrane protein